MLYTVLGCLVESIGMIVITVPLLYPVLGKYGIDPIWFGVILVMYVELGQISPPIGINLFVIQSIWDGELSDVVIGTIPFHIIMFVLLFLLTLFPATGVVVTGAYELIPRDAEDRPSRWRQAFQMWCQVSAYGA